MSVKKASLSEAEFRREAQKMTLEDVEHVLKKQDEVMGKLRGPLDRFVEDVTLLYFIVGDYWNGRYRKIPFYSVAAIVFALVYVLNPADLIPESLSRS